MIKSIKKLFIEYNTYTKGERVAILLLFFIIIAVTLVPLFFNQVSESDKTDFSEFKSYLHDSTNFNNEINDEKERYSLENENKNFHSQYEESKFYAFDPNSISSDQMIQMGFRPYLSERIIKYRNAGGKFLQKEDLLKIYGFSEVFYKQLEPYIVIQKPQIINSEFKTDEPKKTTVNVVNKFKINDMDTNELKMIYGIGSKLSNRIINYRNKLGGFYSNSQISEVYGLSPETMNQLLSKLEESTGDFKKININNASELEITNHPYFKKNIAKLIINYRNQHGKYQTAEDLKNIKVLDDVTFNKIKPYLEF
jgi:competence protein ComEA